MDTDPPIPVVSLPYVEPLPSLTARAPSQTLEQHLLAFLAANNLGGYSPEEAQFHNAFYSACLEVAGKKEMPLDQFKRYAKRVCKLGERRMKLGIVQNTLARSLGYLSYSEMLKYNPRGNIRNIRN